MKTKQKRTKVQVSVLALAVLVFLALCGSASAVEGMVSYWKFDEGSGTTAYDCWGDNHGTIYGAQWTTGIVGGALSFDGVNDYVEVPDDPSLRGMPELTLEVWICPVTLYKTYQGIIVKRNHWIPSNYTSYVLYMQYGAGFPKPGSFMQVVSDNGTSKQAICTDNVLSPNQWSHLVGIYTGETIKVYLNGTSCGEEPFIGGNINNAPLRLIIGAFAYDGGQRGYFNGLIDEVAIYNRALTSEEIAQHYENGVNGLGYLTIPVGIDIKPASYPNSLNMDGHGVIPVAILGSADFDVSEIDVSSLRFAGLAVRVKGQGQPQCSVEDVSGDFSGGLEGAPDGYPDLVCHFVDNPDNWAPGDGEATITGNLMDGTPFAGSDEITVVPPQQQ